ncbi:MAG: GntR family transcriptional regulator [Coriobacteriales bacterium]
MLLTVNLAGDVPIYLQIRQQLIAAIASGELQAGYKLPSVRQLASELGVNMHTVNKAYAVLRDEGFVNMSTRTGAVVASRGELDAQREDAELNGTCSRIGEELVRLAQEHKAAGGCRELFMRQCASASATVFGGSDEGEGEC